MESLSLILFASQCFCFMIFCPIFIFHASLRFFSYKSNFDFLCFYYCFIPHFCNNFGFIRKIVIFKKFFDFGKNEACGIFFNFSGIGFIYFKNILLNINPNRISCLNHFQELIAFESIGF